MSLSAEDKNWFRKAIRRIVADEISKVAAVEPENSDASSIGFVQDVGWTDDDEEPDEEPAEHEYNFPPECRIGFRYPKS